MSVLGGIETRVLNVGTLIGAGLVGPMRPDHLVRFGRLYLAWGPTAALGYAIQAMRRPNETAVIDELGALTFEEIHRRTNSLAHALADAGINEGDRVAVMCRNHRGFIESTVALSKLGADAMYLNTSFAGPQITDVVNREEPERDHLRRGVRRPRRRRGRAAARATSPGTSDGRPTRFRTTPTLEHLIALGDHADPVPPSEPGQQ